MSRAEEITSEVRKLVLTCRSMQAQLEQSIPKKTHQEIVAKMQATIDGLSADLERTKQELSKTTTIGEHLNSLSARVSEQEDRIANQTKIIEAFSQRLAETTVPASMYSEVVAKNKELTEKISCMVSREDYIALQNRFNELESKMAAMVPKVEFESLQAKIATMVPKADYDERGAALSSLQEQYRALETHAAALEAKLADSVPRSDFDELTARIAQLTMEATRFATELASVPSSVETAVTTIPQQSNEVADSSPAQAVAPLAEVSTPSSSPSPTEVQAPVDQQLSEPSQTPSAVEANVAATNASATAAPSPNVQEASPVQATAETVQTQNQESQDIPKPEAVAVESVISPVATSTPEAVAVAAQATEIAEPVVSQSTSTVIAETLTAETPASNQEEQAPVASVADNQSTQEAPKVESVQSEVVPQIASGPATAPATPVQETASLELSTVPSISETKEEQQRQAEEEEEEERQQPPEIREVQSQLSEIHTSAETGQTSFAPSVVVDPSRGFKFTNTDFYATSVIDFLQDLEKVPLETIEYHTRNGDFERWFADVVTDAQCAESLKSIREASYGGEELRTKTIQVIAPKYRAN